MSDQSPGIPKDFPRPDVPLDRQIQEALRPLGVHVDKVAFVSRRDHFVTVVMKGALLTQSMIDSDNPLAFPRTQILTLPAEPEKEGE